MCAKPIYNTKHVSMTRAIYAKFKKHYCSKCGELLSVEWITHKGIKKGSPEQFGKNIRYDFFKTPVDYTFAIFECSKCRYKLSIDDQYFLENPHKLEKYNNKYGDYRLKDDYHNYLKYTQKD